VRLGGGPGGYVAAIKAAQEGLKVRDLFGLERLEFVSRLIRSLFVVCGDRLLVLRSVALLVGLA